MLPWLTLMCPIAVVATLAGTGEANATSPDNPEFLPTVITGGPADVDYPQPICARCVVVSKKETAASGETQGVLELTYEDEVFPSFTGDIIVTVLLPDDVREADVISNVSLAEGEQASWTLTSLPYASAKGVWIELLPTG